jgi:hypothetical protein
MKKFIYDREWGTEIRTSRTRDRIVLSALLIKEKVTEWVNRNPMRMGRSSPCRFSVESEI